MKIDDEFCEELIKAHESADDCVAPHLVVEWFESVLGLLFPEFSRRDFASREQIIAYTEELKHELIQLMVCGKGGMEDESEDIADHFCATLSTVRKTLLKDVDAIFQGDPAARSKDEVIRTYPGFYAMAAHRMAHVLYERDVPLIPRIISEYAHSKTGIDIHPGAVIGEHFCIDHGTGIVIGETTQVGDHVKIYQGVTLGAMSVKKSDASVKRHPTIEDGVVIYAGASILGGETVIGANSVIGGNVWLTESVPAGSTIYYTAKMSHGEGESDTIIYKP
ncbi:serine O-acetyltransferase EpsC [Fodinibius sediminis]|uniref:Serine O-acetyltransferase n=1 Tax=Fodinibius sediminis TaxID=1214077 RepID=A0A521EF01_9BACT|nr:serine O-acetyltransferase EpsC [Fodinibius sediminis]SMO82051.1 serine O-acetyltransferase [Fodinibius sediminis]